MHFVEKDTCKDASVVDYVLVSPILMPSIQLNLKYVNLIIFYLMFIVQLFLT